MSHSLDVREPLGRGWGSCPWIGRDLRHSVWLPGDACISGFGWILATAWRSWETACLLHERTLDWLLWGHESPVLGYAGVLTGCGSFTRSRVTSCLHAVRCLQAGNLVCLFKSHDHVEVLFGIRPIEFNFASTESDDNKEYYYCHCVRLRNMRNANKMSILKTHNQTNPEIKRRQNKRTHSAMWWIVLN